MSCIFFNLIEINFHFFQLRGVGSALPVSVFEHYYEFNFAFSVCNSLYFNVAAVVF